MLRVHGDHGPWRRPRPIAPCANPPLLQPEPQVSEHAANPVSRDPDFLRAATCVPTVVMCVASSSSPYPSTERAVETAFLACLAHMDRHRTGPSCCFRLSNPEERSNATHGVVGAADARWLLARAARQGGARRPLNIDTSPDMTSASARLLRVGCGGLRVGSM